MRPPVVGHRSLSVRADAVLICLVILHLAVKAAFFPRVVDAPLHGDEAAYVDAARTLASLVRDAASFSPLDVQRFQGQVVGRGWFMPGMSLVLAPLYLFHPDAGLATTRAYLGVFTFALLLVTVFSVHRVLGKRYASALLVFPALLPMWVLFSFSAWGDLSAGLLVILLLTLMVQMGRKLQRGAAPTAAEGARLGLLAIATLYIRSSTLPLVLGLFALVLVGLIMFLRGGERGRACIALGIGVAVFAGLLAPWSVAASKTLGATVVSTTTVPISLAVAFGEPDKLCFGPCEPGNIWITSTKFSRDVARERGVSELDVQQEMSDFALIGITAEGYTADVLQNLNRYLFQPGGFEFVFRERGSEPDIISAVVTEITNWGYFGGMVFAVWALLLVTRSSFDSQLTSILLKLFAAALLLQPFLHIGSPRYWPVFAPLFAMSVGLLIQSLREPARSAASEVGATAGAPSRPLFWVQVVLVAAFALTTVALVSLSR